MGRTVAGARFYKCDLQMQTPVDRFHWRGPEKLLPESTPEERDAIAEAYIRRCYETGLEVIGVTEHNLAPGDCASLLPDLLTAIDRLAPDYGYRIEVFPGFEVEVTIGAGIHVLCLFEPGTPVNTLSDKLAEMGLPSGARFKDGAAQSIPVSANLTLDKLVRVVQEDANNPGIIILAHASADSGVMDSGKLMQWWSAEVIKDERILCLELPRPRDYYLELESQTLTKSILQNRDTRYQRSHPIAAICSSDCKRIEPIDGGANHIGFRHTWLKMGTPSIEGLRQAFLDFDSRVRYDAKSPSESFDYPRILKVDITGATFLLDQEIEFSENLNVIIGGSGTGKSTILNYARMCLGQDKRIRGSDTQGSYKKNLETVRSSTRISVHALLGGSPVQVVSTGRTKGELRSSNEDLDGLDPAEIFPVRFFGQREIYAIAEDRMAAMALLDDLHAEELAAAARRCADIAQELEGAASRAARLAQLRQELDQVAAQRARSQAALDSLQAAAAPLATLAIAQDRARLLNRIVEVSADSSSGIEAALAALPMPNGETVPDDERLRRLTERHAAAANILQGSVRAAIEKYRAEVEALSSSDEAGAIRDYLDTAQAAVTAVRADLEARGIQPDSFADHRARLAALSAEQDNLQSRIEDAKADLARMGDFERELVREWERVQNVRIRAADALNEAVPRTATDHPFVEVTVHKYGNDSHFRDVMSSFRGDRRKISDDEWDSLIGAAVEKAASIEEPPNHVWVRWVEAIENGDRPDDFPTADVRLLARVLECFPMEKRAKLLVQRIDDRAEIVLRRQDGTIAGDIEGGLSVGQKCTAILALLLALDTTPVVIDQPEDEIDNEFTYREMVPLLRRVKERRQLIVVTHDPNIPVNGDAELIYALSAVDGKGRVKELDGRPAIGSLDELHVRSAVEEIMEGSEDAFRRRFVKYGF